MEILPGFETFRPASLILSGRMIRCVSGVVERGNDAGNLIV